MEEHGMRRDAAQNRMHIPEFLDVYEKCVEKKLANKGGASALPTHPDLSRPYIMMVMLL
jgi:hypothetical protein